MLKAENVTKTYPGVTALDNVSLEFQKGEVHALMGENGAGKSTLIKILAGAIKPDSGRIILDGKAYSSMSPPLALRLGLAVIYQDIFLVQPMTVAENIFLGQRFGKLFSQRKLRAMAQDLIDSYGFGLDAGAPVLSLSPASQQLVEVMKAVSNNARVMIMDEPTASLASHEVERLFDAIRKLKASGVTIVYISHRLDEVFAISDRVSILRDGKHVATLETACVSRDKLVSLMVGRELSSVHPKREAALGSAALEARGLTGNSVYDVSFTLRKGEILGLAGLVGSGRTQCAQLLAGAKPIERGKLLVNGLEAKIKSPSDAIALGIGLVPEERKEEGLIVFSSLMFNTTLICLKDYCKAGILNSRKRRLIADEFKERLSIRAPGINQQVASLSGGNQQKVVVSKLLAGNLGIIVFDEPTKGVDVGAKHEIYQLMNGMVSSGKSIVMISSDMEELLGMSDRIIVLHEGRVSGELSRSEFSQERVLELASGLKRMEGIA